MNESEPLDEVSKIRNLWHQNRGDGRLTGMSTEGTCLLSVRCPAHRRHDLYLGCYAEHRKLGNDVKGKAQDENHRG